MTNRLLSPSWFGVVGAVLAVVLAATMWWPAFDDAAPSASTLSVPVFDRASSPIPAAAASIAPTPVAKPVGAVHAESAFRLLGTVVAANGADSFALVRRTADSQLMQLRAGEVVGGLTVRAIESNDVVLAGAGEAVVVKNEGTAASPLLSREVSPPPFVPDVEPAWAGDPAPFGH